MKVLDYIISVYVNIIIMLYEVGDTVFGGFFNLFESKNKFDYDRFVFKYNNDIIDIDFDDCGVYTDCLTIFVSSCHVTWHILKLF